MTDNPLPRHAAVLMNQFRRLQALVLASIQVARDRIESLYERQDQDDLSIADIDGRIARLQRWIGTAEHQLMWVDNQSHEVGVLVEKINMGIINPNAEMVRRLVDVMSKKYEEVAVDALEHLGRGPFNRALDVGAELLTDQAASEEHEELETTDEFEELMTEVNNSLDNTAEEESEIEYSRHTATDDDDEYLNDPTTA